MEYSAVSAVVSVIVILLRVIALLPRTGEAGAEFASLLYVLLALAWGIITCLIAPALAAENISGLDAIRRCRDLLRFTWGRQISGAIWMWACLFLATLVVVFGYFILSAVLLAIAHTFFVAVISTIVFFVVLMGLALIYNTIGNIFSVTLYQDALAGIQTTARPQGQGVMLPGNG